MTNDSEVPDVGAQFNILSDHYGGARESRTTTTGVGPELISDPAGLPCSSAQFFVRDF